MSSNALWKVTSQPPSIMGRCYGLCQTSGKSPRSSPNTSQDEPIDFSQKSDRTTPSDTSFENDGQIRKKIKVEPGTDFPNYRKSPNILCREYFRTRVPEPSAIQPNIMSGYEQIEFQPMNSSPKVESGYPFPYYGANLSPLSDISSNGSSPGTHEADVRNIMSSPEPIYEMVNGRVQPVSPKVNDNGMDVRNGGAVSPRQVNGHSPNSMVPPTFSEAAHFLREMTSPAALMNGRRPSIPIMNPLNVRNSNGSSPGLSTGLVPFLGDPERGFHTPNLWRSGYPPPSLQTSILQAQLEDKKSVKHVRPFKAFSNDLIAQCQRGMPAASIGVPSSGLSMNPASCYNFDQYMDSVSKRVQRTRQAYTRKVNVPKSSTTTDVVKDDIQSATITNGSGERSSSQEPKENNESNDSICVQNGDSQEQPTEKVNGRKRGNPVPDDKKDLAYKLRREKNNIAAKRSRDNRKRKEDALAVSTNLLMEENYKLNLHLKYRNEENKKLEDENQYLKVQRERTMSYVYLLENRGRECTSCSTKIPFNLDKRPML